MLSKLSIAQQFSDVDSILNGRCAVCGFDLDIETHYSKGLPFVVCTNPNGGYDHPRQQVPTWLARDWEDFKSWQDMAYGLWEEEDCEEASE